MEEDKKLLWHPERHQELADNASCVLRLVVGRNTDSSSVLQIVGYKESAESRCATQEGLTVFFYQLRNLPYKVYT